MGDAFGYKPMSIATHIFVIITYTLCSHHAFSIFIRTYEYDLTIGGACSLVAIDMNHLLPVDMKYGFETSEKVSKGFSYFLLPF